jgi:hypothetical protein
LDSKFSTPIFLVESMLLIVLVFCAILLCVFTFWVLCCDVRYDLCIKTMFASFFPPVVCKRAYLRYLCLLRILASNTYCAVFLFLFFSSSCVPYVATFSGLFDCPFLNVLRRSLTVIFSSSYCEYSTKWINVT